MLMTWKPAMNRPRFIKNKITGSEVIKLFSSSAQLSMKFQMLINVDVIKISGKFRFKTKKTSNLPC